MWRKIAVGVLIATAIGGATRAEVTEVHMSKQFGLPYLPMIVIEAQQLIEKNAKAAGLGDVKTTWTQRAGPAAELDALLAGQADFIGPGVPTLATIWDKTIGTPQEARALIAMQSMPFRAGDAQSERENDQGFHRQGQDRAAGGQAHRPRHRTGNRSRQNLGPGSLRQARLDHHHAVACRCRSRGDVRPAPRSIHILPVRRSTTTSWRPRASIRS